MYVSTPHPSPLTPHLVVRSAGTCWISLLFLLLPLAAQAGPQIEQWQTQNGARVYFVAAPELPMVDVRVVFDAGSARDGGKPGLAALTSGLLDDGAKTADGELNADQIAERFADLGAQFGTGADRDTASVSLRSLTKPELLQPALQAVAAILTQPGFPQAGFEREQSRVLTQLQAQEQSPGEIAGKAFFKAVYGEHPYATQALGNPDSIKQLTRDDLIAFHNSYYVARNAVVAIVGAVTRKEAEAIAETLAGKLPEGETAPALPKVADLKSAQTVQIPYSSAQTHILAGQPGISRNDPDYFPLVVGNHILGGNGLVARLAEEIREKRGLSYSTYSYFQPLREPGPYTLGLQTRNEQTGEALTVLRDTLKNYVERGPTAAELKAAKQNITGGFALRIDSNANLLDYLALIGFYQLPLDYLDSYNRKVEQVTLEQIRDAFKRRVKPEQMVTVIVGGGAQANQN